MVRALCNDYDVEVVALLPDGDPAAPVVAPDLPGVTSRLVSPPRRSRSATVTVAIARRWPVRVASTDWAAAASGLGRRQDPVDLLWLGALDHAVGLRGSIAARRTVVDVDDVETVKWRTALASGREAITRVDQLQRRLELPLWSRLQDQVLASADAVCVCSELDRRRLASDRRKRAGGGARICVLPNTYPDPGSLRRGRVADPPSMLLAGTFSTEENADAAQVAAREVLPRVRRALPETRLRLVGRGGASLTQLIGLPGVDVVGEVDDIAPELARAHLVLAPIRVGGGTRLKLIEALAHEVPVVSTSVGAEGLAVTRGLDIELADGPDGLAAACLGLLREPDRARRQAKAGRLLYERCYRPAVAQLAVASIAAPDLPARASTLSAAVRRRERGGGC